MLVAAAIINIVPCSIEELQTQASNRDYSHWLWCRMLLQLYINAQKPKLFAL